MSVATQSLMKSSKKIPFPVSTGVGARILGTTEPKLADAVRRGKVHPEPLIFAGRRQWSAHHLLLAGEALGVLTDELRAKLREEVFS